MDEDLFIEQEMDLTDSGRETVENIIRSWRNGWSLDEIIGMNGEEYLEILVLLALNTLNTYVLPEDME